MILNEGTATKRKGRIMWQLLRRFGFLLLCVYLFTGCPGGEKFHPDNFDPSMIPDTPTPGGWVLIHQLSDPEGLNPYTTNDAASSEINIKIFEPLLTLDWETAELVPWIAKRRAAISPDYLTYTFVLRDSVFFSDGVRLTAKDVVFSFKALKNPLVIDAAPLRNYYNNVVDVQAPDDTTVIIRLSEPYFLAEYFLGGLQIIPKHIFDPENLTDQYTIAQTNDLENAPNNEAMKKFAEWFNSAEVKREPRYMIGTGPYIVEEWRTNEFIRLTRNPRYWKKDEPVYPEKIVFRTINDRTAAVTALKNQDIDIMTYVPPNLFEDIDTVRVPHIRKTSYIVPTYYYIGWNLTSPLFSDKRVRQALSHMVDKQQLIATLMRGFAVPTESPIFFQRPEYDSTLPPYDYNPEKARKLLAEAGWNDTDGDGILDKVINGEKKNFEFTILVNSGNEIRENLALLLSDELKKIGIRAKVQKLEWSIFLEFVRDRRFDAVILGWVADPTPPDPYQIWHSSQIAKGGSNYVGFSNPRVDRLLEMNRREFDPEKRKEYMHEFQRILHEEQPYTFLWFIKYPAAYNKRLQNVKFYAVRPGYNVNEWWIPPQFRRFAQ